MVRDEFTFPSADGKTPIHAVEWRPEGPVRAVLQISHGVSEYILRYEPLAEYLTERGFAVAGHDHLGHGESVVPGGARMYFGPGAAGCGWRRTWPPGAAWPGSATRTHPASCWATPWAPSWPGRT